jgi:hypothetical protein
MKTNKDEEMGIFDGLGNLPLINDIPEATTSKNKPSMEWIVKIENKPNQRILVKFEPKFERIVFVGQYKVKTWIDFSEDYIDEMNFDLETIQKLLLKVYEKMNERIAIHEDLTQSFGIIKTIEIKEE